jgi:hypothetical protein
MKTNNEHRRANIMTSAKWVALALGRIECIAQEHEREISHRVSDKVPVILADNTIQTLWNPL